MVRGAVFVTPLYEALMLALVLDGTVVVVTVNVAVRAPALTVTVAGRVAAALSLESVTEAPPVGAALVKVTVPVEGLPPATLDGFSVTPERAAGTLMVSSEVLVTPFAPALIVATVPAKTDVVVTVNVAVVAPALTVTLDGTVAFALSLESETTVPPEGAAPVKVTVPVEGFPPTTVAGFKETPESADPGVTVRDAVLVTPLNPALIVAVTEVATVVVVTENVAVTSPAATVTLVGTTAAVLSLESDTVVPPAGAAPVKVTVPREVPPPETLAGLSDTPDIPNVGEIVRTAVCVPPL
jgi:hypothetical protein